MPHGLANAAGIAQVETDSGNLANPLYPVPVLMDTEELEHIYHMIMEGHDQ